mgnify:CR=1 FL=1|tara:strand:- start:332 stop:484 length:153 start_codon:yes stop_codon:yes gene_type:complete
MSTKETFDVAAMIEDLFDQIHDLQDFISYIGVDEQDFIKWQTERDNITYH